MFSASERWNRIGSCGTMAIWERSDACVACADILAVDQDTAAGRVVEALDQLDEGGLARSRRPDQTDALSGPDGDRQVLVQRHGMGAVAERHAVEADFAGVDADRLGVGAVLDPQRLVVDGDQFLHLVDRALEMVDVHADVAQVAVDDEIRREDIGDIAGRRPPVPPQDERGADDCRPHDQQDGVLRGPATVVAGPGAPGAVPPLGDGAGKPLVLPRFGAESLDDGVAADRVGQHAAEPCIQGVGQLGRRRHIWRGEISVRAI